MRISAFVLIAAGLISAGEFVVAQDGAPGAPPKYSFAEPGISPDGREIAFSSGGEIWSVPAAGGDAHVLVADSAFDRRPLFSPDGRELAFVSTRTGGGDIYIVTLATGLLRRLTFDDGLEQLDGWSRDGRWIYFSSTSHDISGMNDLFRVSREGGTPMAVSADRYVNEFGAAASPDGRRVAFSARGNGSAQWWRKSGSHLDESELWLLDLDKAGTPGAYTEITKRDSRQLWPMWNGDGSALFYVADRGGAENVWTRPASSTGADRALTTFRDGRVLWPSITTDGKTVAFERNFGLWTLDTASGQTREVPIVRRGVASSPAPERTRQTNQFSNLALSPDGKKIVFVARGDLFAVSAKDGGDAQRVTTTPEIESQPVWAPDSRRIAYVSARQGGQQIYLYDFGASAEVAISSGAATDISPVFSPDGASLAFLRNRKELHVIDLPAKTDRTIATGIFADSLDAPRPVWSPDGKWLALFAIDAKGFTNAALVAARGDGPPRPVTYLANTNSDSIVWSRDGTYLLFATNQRTEAGQLARVDLTLRTPKFREDLFRDLFNEPKNPPGTPAEPRPSTSSGRPEPVEGRNLATPVSVVFDNIRDRLSLLPLGVDVRDVSITPDGKTAIVVAAAAGQSNVWAYSLDELATDRPVARQLSTTAGNKSSPQITPDSREVYYLDGGRINIVTIDRREARPLNVTAEFTTDFAHERVAVFQEGWTLLRDNFFDANFNGVNWDQSRETYGERAAAAATPDELRRVMSLMIGDLNASHLGISGPAAPPAVGRLGLEFDRAAYEASGAMKVTSVVPLGPAALAGAIHVGDTLTAIDGHPTGARVNLEELLANTIDRRVVLQVSSPGQPARDVVVRPTNQATEKALIYRRWVDQNREYVAKISGGRLGYVHMSSMSAAALDQLYIDLDADNHARDGVVIDIRNNNGGFVNAYAIDVFTRQPYLRMASRGLPEMPARTLLGQRSLELATVLVTNQHSLSDAEDFTEGYRALKLGSVVGEPTSGWIIYTSDVRLVDGSTLRLPHTRIRGADGADMERHPRPVDFAVTRPIGETMSGKDSQLDEAVRVLLKKLGKAE